MSTEANSMLSLIAVRSTNMINLRMPDMTVNVTMYMAEIETMRSYMSIKYAGAIYKTGTSALLIVSNNRAGPDLMTATDSNLGEYIPSISFEELHNCLDPFPNRVSSVSSVAVPMGRLGWRFSLVNIFAAIDEGVPLVAHMTLDYEADSGVSIMLTIFDPLLRTPNIKLDPNQLQLRHTAFPLPVEMSCFQTSHPAHLLMVWLNLIDGRWPEKFSYAAEMLNVLPDTIKLETTSLVKLEKEGPTLNKDTISRVKQSKPGTHLCFTSADICPSRLLAEFAVELDLEHGYYLDRLCSPVPPCWAFLLTLCLAIYTPASFVLLKVHSFSITAVLSQGRGVPVRSTHIRSKISGTNVKTDRLGMAQEISLHYK
ncbi:hypothetical protein F4782DRAFT_524654 [Xylaria castorea]|nr:hypothetical protein F4782DRAFT_524654 [Xylaria castorea]